jgi:hypothetical protein
VAFAASDTGTTPVSAAFSAATTPTTGTATPDAGKHARGGWLRRLEHGEFTVRTKSGHEVIAVQRGQVTSVTATQITVKSADGFTATYTVDANTKVRKAKQAATIAAVHTGDKIGVFAVDNGSIETAKRIADGS